MPRLTAEEYPVLPAGEYRAVIKDIQDGPDTYGPTLKFWFEITHDPDYAGESTTALASRTFTPKAKLRKWVESLTGRTFQAGEFFDTDQLLNRPCRITVEEKITPDGVYNRVLAVMPAERTTRPARRTQAQQPAPRQRPAPQTEEESDLFEESDTIPFYPIDLSDDEPPTTASSPSHPPRESAAPVDEIPF